MTDRINLNPEQNASDFGGDENFPEGREDRYFWSNEPGPESWKFGQLVGAVFTRNYMRATIDRLEEVYGAVYGVIELSVAKDG